VTDEQEQFVAQIQSSGYAILPGILPAAMLVDIKRDLEEAIEKEEEYRVGRNIASHYGMVLLCSLYGGSLVEVLDLESLMRPFEWVLGEGCIIYAYTSSSMPPRDTNYSARVHVDCPRLIPGYMTNMGATILLDDFSEENGATWFLPDSHTRLNPPPEAEFYAQGRRVIAAAGSVFYFDARLWHAGGLNRTNDWRHALTLNMCRPYMKQRIDIPRAMAHTEHRTFPARVRQKLGFRSQPPTCYDEYYAPAGQRTFAQEYE
jgi:ectoine hydroxylase-related dioxygenase (phytanoyl-CoA dioxygenase family)